MGIPGEFRSQWKFHKPAVYRTGKVLSVNTICRQSPATGNMPLFTFPGECSGPAGITCTLSIATAGRSGLLRGMV